MYEEGGNCGLTGGTILENVRKTKKNFTQDRKYPGRMLTQVLRHMKHSPRRQEWTGTPKQSKHTVKTHSLQIRL